jgi:hypothetical protein
MTMSKAAIGARVVDISGLARLFAPISRPLEIIE